MVKSRKTLTLRVLRVFDLRQPTCIRMKTFYMKILLHVWNITHIRKALAQIFCITQHQLVK